jgi:diguanylate cyclase (GGDEF)-like protein
VVGAERGAAPPSTRSGVGHRSSDRLHEPPRPGCGRGGRVRARGALRHPVWLIIIDLDDFKGYNDSHGHIAGDRLLAWVVARIAATLRPTDSLARLGGDEFVVLVAGADAAAAEPLAARIHEACLAQAPHCTGIASAPADGVDFDALYRAADHRPYEAKRSRRRMSAVPSARSRSISRRSL